MSQAAALRRLERLEAQAYRQSLEPYIQELAAEFGVDVDELLAHAEGIAKRESEVGMEQTVAEVAAVDGIDPAELWASVQEHLSRDASP